MHMGGKKRNIIIGVSLVVLIITGSFIWYMYDSNKTLHLGEPKAYSYREITENFIKNNDLKSPQTFNSFIRDFAQYLADNGYDLNDTIIHLGQSLEEENISIMTIDYRIGKPAYEYSYNWIDIYFETDTGNYITMKSGYDGGLSPTRQDQANNQESGYYRYDGNNKLTNKNSYMFVVQTDYLFDLVNKNNSITLLELEESLQIKLKQLDKPPYSSHLPKMLN